MDKQEKRKCSIATANHVANAQVKGETTTMK